MVTMKRKRRRKSVKENGRREMRGEASFRPILPLQCTTLLFFQPFLLDLHFSESRLVSAPGCVPFWPKHRVSAMGPYNMGCLWP